MDFMSLMSTAGKYGKAAGGPLGAVNSFIGNLNGIKSGLNSLFGSHSAERRAMDNQKNLMDYSIGLQKDLYKFQNDIQLENWNMQNEYNSPAAQMARYKSAGLNPNLIYGGNGAVAGNAESVGSASGGSPNASGDMKVLSGLAARQMDLQNMAYAKSIEKIDSEIDVNEANKDNIETNTEYTRDHLFKQSDAITENYQWQSKRIDQFMKYFDDTIELNKENLRLVNEKIKIDTQAAKAQLGATLYNLEHILPLTKQEKEFTLFTLLPLKADQIRAEIQCTREQASNLAMNSLYTGTLIEMQRQENKFKKFLYGSRFYRQGILNKIIGEGEKALNDAEKSLYEGNILKLDYGDLKDLGIKGSGWIQDGARLYHRVYNDAMGFFGVSPKSFWRRDFSDELIFDSGAQW